MYLAGLKVRDPIWVKMVKNLLTDCWAKSMARVTIQKGLDLNTIKLKNGAIEVFNKIVGTTMKLYVLQHVHEISSEVEDVKLIGIYSSIEQANTAKDYLKNKPGFLNNQEGFFIDEYELDKTFWEDGFYSG